jgi:hypothetical protein
MADIKEVQHELLQILNWRIDMLLPEVLQRQGIIVNLSDFPYFRRDSLVSLTAVGQDGLGYEGVPGLRAVQPDSVRVPKHFLSRVDEICPQEPRMW